MGLFDDIGAWLMANEGLISAMAGLTAMAVILFSPMGRGVARSSRRFAARLRGDAGVEVHSHGARDSDRLSIAVLPFDNLSEAEEDAYFADGMTEDILTLLSTFSHMTIIARNSTFAYKGKAADVREIGEHLNVRYVLEGSVRRMGDRIRVTAQLIESETGSHVWAENYDRPIVDLFDIQDDLIEHISTHVGSVVQNLEFQRAKTSRTRDLDAWGLFFKAVSLMAEPSPLTIAEAEKYCREAILRDPDFAPAHAGLAASLSAEITYGLASDKEKVEAEVHDQLRIAIGHAPEDPLVLCLAAQALNNIGEVEEAVSYAERATRSAPKYANGWAVKANLMRKQGRNEEALHDAEEALRLGPNEHFVHFTMLCAAFANMSVGAYETAERHLRDAMSRHDDDWCRIALVAALSYQHKDAAARETLAGMKGHRDDFTLAKIRELLQVLSFPEAEVELYIEGLKMAGLE